MAQPPNIVWIFPDQLRNDALGCYGNRWGAGVRTPSIDRIAARGVRFDRSYVTAPICVPSRMCFMTGMYPEQTGVYNNEGAWPVFSLDEPPETFPEVFARHGYRTASFGKRHLPRQMQPWQHGDRTGSAHADTSRGLSDEEVRAIRSAEPPGVRGGVFPGDRPFAPERLTDGALAWLDAVEQPFFLRLGYLQPHDPVFVPEPFASMYDDAPFPTSADMSGSRSAFERRFGELGGMAELSPEAFHRQYALYYGLVAWLDGQVGRVLDYLERRGLLENTVVVFNADHGMLLGEGGAYAKQIYAPQSQQIPFIVCGVRGVRGDGFLPAGVVRDDITDNLDLARTLFGLAGIEAPAQFGGRDLFGDPAPEAIFGTIGYGLAGSRAFPNGARGTYLDGRGWPQRSCVRTARYRLDKNTRIDGRAPAADEADVFLADTLADPDEKVNLAADPTHAGTVVRLSRLIDEHQQGAVYPPVERITMSADDLRRYADIANGDA